MSDQDNFKDIQWLQYALAVALGVMVVAIVIFILTRSSPLAPVEVDPDASGDTAVLLAQLETMRMYEERNFQLILWSLGGLVTVAAIMATFGWFANKSMYDRDVERLRQQIDERAAALETSMKAGMEHIDEVQETRLLDMYNILGFIQAEQGRNQIKTLEIERELWLLKGSPEIALIIEAGRLGTITTQENHSTKQVSDSLFIMGSWLERVPDSSLSEWVTAAIRRALSNVQAEFEHDVKRIERILERKADPDQHPNTE